MHCFLFVRNNSMIMNNIQGKSIIKMTKNSTFKRKHQQWVHQNKTQMNSVSHSSTSSVMLFPFLVWPLFERGNSKTAFLECRSCFTSFHHFVTDTFAFNVFDLRINNVTIKKLITKKVSIYENSC